MNVPYDIGIKLSKLVNSPPKAGFLKTVFVNVLFSLQILTFKSEKLLLFFNFRSGFIVRMLVIHIIKKFK